MRVFPGTVEVLTACALVSSYAAHVLGSRQTEWGSEILCWLLLPVLFGFVHTRRVERSSLDPEFATVATSGGTLWLFAVGIGIACFCRAENNALGLFPTLVPLVLVVQRYLRREKFSTGQLGPVVGVCFTTIVGFLTLFQWDVRKFISSSILVLALLGALAFLLPENTARPQWLPLVDLEESIKPVWLRIVVVLSACLGLRICVFGFPQCSIISVVLVGVLKASSWYLASRIAQEASWGVAPAIETCVLTATRSPLLASSELGAVLPSVASFFTLGQAIYLLPKRKESNLLWLFLAVPLSAYLWNDVEIRSSISAASHGLDTESHPVATLVQQGRSRFESLIQRQSKSYEAAHAEYVRRYGLDPPHGFARWYEFAVSWESAIIDDFDILHETISPLLKISGREILENMEMAYELPDPELWLCEYSKDVSRIRCSHPRRIYDRHIGHMLDRFTAEFKDELDGVKVLFNHLDEPSVLAPSEGSDNPLITQTNMAHRSIWNEITKSCIHSEGQEENEKVRTFGLSFVTNTSSFLDLCRNPEYRNMHGLLMGPSSMRLIEGKVPILSTGALSTMGDILYPSAAYIESDFTYEEEHDLEWNEKRNNLYWAGSTSGGFANDAQWNGYQRQRFVGLAQNIVRQQHTYLQEKGTVLEQMPSYFLNSRLYDVAFTRIFQCSRGTCQDQDAHFRTKSWADKDEAFRSRLVFDLDGNGISGRYYKLLASKSVPLKQTLLREWHDDRLIPWYHYIPVSLSMEELPELVTYLTLNSDGQRMAEEIASQGREWHSKALREVDMSVYLYRLLLELARVQDPNRPAMLG